ncbi:MAG: hypothetical protein EOO71_07175 [Myxococcaceae bacterium]|nr:MAG: hypothetical protein EOO71_07175 [Myxococcaceae bacterium]
MRALNLHAGLLLALCAVACVEPEDKASRVHDFRVLGLATEPPELMAPACDASAESGAALAAPVTFRALLVDPSGGGRAIDYSLWACADPDDQTCADTAQRVLLAQGSTTEAELSLPLRPGDAHVEDGTPLLARVLQADPYQGLGGLRMPLVLHARAGGEQVYAQKLMVFSCPLVPGMNANQNPVLPELNLDGAPWTARTVPEPHGLGPFVVTLDDLTDRQEAYVVPGLRQESVRLTESWKVSWHASFGEFSPEETGGAGLGGEPGRHRTEWKPPEQGGDAREVLIWAVVRDGRGGQSWVGRRARWSP